MLKSLYKIGAIVALKTHPYKQDIISTIISGDTQIISPLLIIVEILGSNSSKVQTIGLEVNKIQYKCIWYSHKFAKFEEQWIAEELLIPINTKVKNLKLKKTINVGNLVALKTLDLEMGKIKSSLTSDYGNEESINNKTSINPLLTFLSPIMQIIEVKDNLIKSDGTKMLAISSKRVLSEYSLKCKWYNSILDKMSESIIPIESLQKIDEVDKHILSIINKHTQSLIFYRISGSIVRPKNILFKSGRFYLSGYNYVSNKYEETLITSAFKVEKKAILAKAPSSITAKNNETSIKDVTGKIKLASKHKLLLRIKYKNRNEKITIRTVSKYTLDKKVSPKYITGYCHLREEERTFHIERIQNVQILNIAYP